MTQEDQIVKRVLQQFDGVYSLQALDALFIVEQTITKFSGILHTGNLIQQFQKNQWQDAALYIKDKGIVSICYQNQYITLYELQWEQGTAMFNNEKSYYFQNSPDAELQHLNNRNLEETYHNTRLYEDHLMRFLQHYRATWVNPKTKQLLFIEFLNQIDTR